MPSGLNMRNWHKPNAGMSAGMNTFNRNVLCMANLSTVGIFPEVQGLLAQIAAAGGELGQQGLAHLSAGARQ